MPPFDKGVKQDKELQIQTWNPERLTYTSFWFNYIAHLLQQLSKTAKSLGSKTQSIKALRGIFLRRNAFMDLCSKKSAPLRSKNTPELCFKKEPEVYDNEQVIFWTKLSSCCLWFKALLIGKKKRKTKFSWFWLKFTTAKRKLTLHTQSYYWAVTNLV